MSGGMHTPSQQFHDAASYLSQVSSLSSVSNAVKLELYGLFKYVTVSPTPSTSKPSIFDMAGRAKWDAWNIAGRKYTDPSEAEQRYIQMAGDLGWVEGTKVEFSQSNEDETEDIWDDDDDVPSRVGGQGGMGAVVSSVVRPDEVTDNTIHSLAVCNDVTGLTRLLEEHPNTNINGRDEFGYTPLHLAADRGNKSTLELLLKKGADPTIKDEDGFAPLELAKIAGHDDIANILSTTATR